MGMLRTVSALVLLCILGLTFAVVSQYGWNFVTPFVGSIFAMTWQGQFNFDFASYLLISTLWFVWRNGATTKTFLMAPFILIGGMLVFAPYLLYLSFRCEGRLDVLLIGPHRAARLNTP